MADSLVSALEKLAAGNPPLAANRLPPTDDPVWTDIRSEYGLNVAELSSLKSYAPHAGILADCSEYRVYGGRNGVDPSSFIPREVAAEILDALPRTFAEANQDTSILRVLLHGSPGSGKTSILGHIFEQLNKRYRGQAQVFYVNGSKLSQSKEALRAALVYVRQGVVLLDDAHLWYESDSFFQVFKGSEFILVAAATYSVSSKNPTTPVEFQKKLPSVLLPQEANMLFARLGVDISIRDTLLDWFGSSFGRIWVFVPQLLELWSQAKTSQADLTLEQFFFRASTLNGLANARFVPDLSDDIKEILLHFWRGQLPDADKERLSRYGVLSQDGDWSCEFVRRLYFSQLFHSHDEEWEMFGTKEDGMESIPSSLELVKKGLEELAWASVKKCAESSTTGFPIENVWQTFFYSAIGHFIPHEFPFCKERVVGTQDRVDFVLRNGSTCGIEFLIKSDRVDAHHQRFETGPYARLNLDDYIVVDILPWPSRVQQGNKRPRDLHDVSHEECIDVASTLFQNLTPARRQKHAIFFVANNLKSGILFTYDAVQERAMEATRSPRTA